MPASALKSYAWTFDRSGPMGRSCGKFGCFVLLAFASLGPLSPAVAQTSTAGGQSPDNAGPLDEIVVTARRTTELLQKVPVSVVALSEKELESRSVTNLRSLQNFVPNLTFAPSQNVGEAAGNIFIRGIGQEDFGIGAEPGVDPRRGDDPQRRSRP